ncbi:hypothetical protein ACFQZI_11235 [Mucilaginibacter lutimaris]|uniref:Glycosyltransferase family 2 protein n=1 Tax=Mucilaginibacter lutimaris TaxID=931629 RepID=A0ABW2ZGV6_9SPHI
MNQKVSLQINLAPGDFPHVQHLLPHQLNRLQAQVNEIILTVDTQPGNGRFADGWFKHESSLKHWLETVIEPNYPVKIVPVNYTPAVKQEVARYFFNKDNIPVKDFRGGPFYAYFFGLHTAANDLVFHLDSDIFLGGGSPQWVEEAVKYLKDDLSCFVMAPLPGPPRDDDTLVDQRIIEKIAPFTWQLEGMSTRIFLMDRSKFKAHKLELDKPSLRMQLKAIIEQHDIAELPERLIANYIKSHNLKRIDFLGTAKGMWSLHPPYRTASFYKQLPEIIRQVEANNLPLRQRGFYDLIDEVCDWTEAREKIKQNRWWRR